MKLRMEREGNYYHIRYTMKNKGGKNDLKNIYSSFTSSSQASFLTKKVLENGDCLVQYLPDNELHMQLLSFYSYYTCFKRRIKGLF